MINQVTTAARRVLLRQCGAGLNSSRNAATKVQLRNTMDDLPIPNGSWETTYKANQTKYNMHLAFGVIFTAVSLIAAQSSGYFKLYSSPPPLPRD